MILDLVLITIIALSTFLGYRKGFINLSVKLLAFIIAIVATFILITPLTNLVINVTSVDETIENTIIENVNEVIDVNTDNEIMQELIESATNGLLPKKAEEISISVIKVAVGIIIFVGVRVGLGFVTFLANLVAKIPVIKEINKAGGVIYGLVRGVLIIYLAMLLINVTTLLNNQSTIIEKINESSIAKVMYEHNPINIVF